jgi:aryl-alcohol dehydrogenase-like predicted oxidoreductase
MRSLEFTPIGRRTSRIGLGCGRLVGRSSLRRSAAIVEAALALGIRYFDVAPSYGLGTAEEVLGEVLGDSQEVVIATKVGVPRPVYSASTDRLRLWVKPLLDRARALKSIVRHVASSASSAQPRPRYDFSASAIRMSLEESLRRLRRGSVEVFLAHEPHPEDLTDAVGEGFERLHGEGLIRAHGVGIGAVSDRWSRFGSIWQSGWPGQTASVYAADMAHVWHGAVRTWQSSWASARSARPSAVVREVLEASPEAILLVSASTPERLRELLAEVDR